MSVSFRMFTLHFL